MFIALFLCHIWCGLWWLYHLYGVYQYILWLKIRFWHILTGQHLMKYPILSCKIHRHQYAKYAAHWPSVLSLAKTNLRSYQGKCVTFAFSYLAVLWELSLMFVCLVTAPAGRSFAVRSDYETQTDEPIDYNMDETLPDSSLMPNKTHNSMYNIQQTDSNSTINEMALCLFWTLRL